MKNKYPQKCENCGLTVNPGQGQTYKRGDKKWVTYHDMCQSQSKRKSGSQIEGDMFKGDVIGDENMRDYYVFMSEIDEMDGFGSGNPEDFGDH